MTHNLKRRLNFRAEIIDRRGYSFFDAYHHIDPACHCGGRIDYWGLSFGGLHFGLLLA